jgi:hypothetical protein
VRYNDEFPRAAERPNGCDLRGDGYDSRFIALALACVNTIKFIVSTYAVLDYSYTISHR